MGAIGGAIAGDAGEGAAIGAGVGAAAGLLKQGRHNRQAKAQQQAQAKGTSDRYDKAYGVCLEGRGYQVK
jgi:gas vesicle protein